MENSSFWFLTSLSFGSSAERLHAVVHRGPATPGNDTASQTDPHRPKKPERKGKHMNLGQREYIWSVRHLRCRTNTWFTCLVVTHPYTSVTTRELEWQELFTSNLALSLTVTKHFRKFVKKQLSPELWIHKHVSDIPASIWTTAQCNQAMEFPSRKWRWYFRILSPPLTFLASTACTFAAKETNRFERQNKASGYLGVNKSYLQEHLENCNVAKKLYSPFLLQLISSPWLSQMSFVPRSFSRNLVSYQLLGLNESHAKQLSVGE